MFRLLLGLLLSIHWPTAPSARPVRCLIQDSKTKEGYFWLVDATLKLPDGTEKTWLISVREIVSLKDRAAERKKAAKDCEDFAEHFEKLLPKGEKK